MDVNLIPSALRSKAIDKYLLEENTKREETFGGPKVLLLGASDSGKSTFLKQLRLLYTEGFTDHERKDFKIQIITGLLAVCLRVIDELEDWAKDCYSGLILFATQGVVTANGLDPEIISSIEAFWSDPVVKEKYQSLSSVIPHNTYMYFNMINSIGTKEYLPSNDDILNLRTVTQTIQHHTFFVNDLHYNFYDVSGLKYHRKRWLPYFHDATVLMFIVNMDGYRMTMSEDGKTNRMKDSIDLFKSCVNHEFLKNAGIILFFNKHDLFLKSLESYPVTDYFPGYNGKANDPTAVVAYFKKKFQQQLENENRSLVTHRTCCTDQKLMKTVIHSIMVTRIAGNMENML
ncbi:guanine nucleotide binding protein, alpha subunit [Globomyces pollinis-pini]|nr:guanine nucleotide binding protein, alpha subunit [Globomyces pollinis-pini]